MGNIRSPLLLHRTTESTQVHWEGQGGVSKQLLSSLPAQGEKNRALGNQFYSPTSCAWKTTAYKGPGGTPWNPRGPAQAFKVDPMLWINLSSYRLFRQHEQQLENQIAIFLNKYFFTKEYQLLRNSGNCSNSSHVNPQSFPPTQCTSLTRTLSLNSSRQIIFTIYSALARFFFFNSAFRCYF